MSAVAGAPAGERGAPTGRTDPLTDLALTLPVFVGYHLGVVFLDVRNAADLVTSELVALARHSLPAYAALTLALGAALCVVLVALGRGHTLRASRFALVGLEGVLYAVLMTVAARQVVGALRLGGHPGGAFAGLVMSLGAGFYEELFFRVGLFGFGAWALRLVVPVVPGWVVTAGWALVAAVIFSGWHYVGPFGDPFELRSFVFRAVCGVVFTVIYALRGFAPAVWTHALYDIWVLAL